MTSRTIHGDVRGVPVAPLTLDGAADEVERWIADGEHGYACLANVHVIETARRDARLASALTDATLVLPDGAPVAWWLRRAIRADVRRLAGADIFEELCRRSLASGHTHFFVGGTNDALERLRIALEETFPGIRIVGMQSPPFRAPTAEEEAELVTTINEAAPDIVWVGLGAPKQELWMARNRPALDAPALLGVGAVFDFASGMRRRAPRWVQALALEWAYRLAQEPRRLWRRYLSTNTSFAIAASVEAARRRPATGGNAHTARPVE